MHPPVALRHCGNELILCLPLRASRHSIGTRDLTGATENAKKRTSHSCRLGVFASWRTILNAPPRRMARSLPNELIRCLSLRASRHSTGTRDLTRCAENAENQFLAFLLPCS